MFEFSLCMLTLCFEYLLYRPVLASGLTPSWQAILKIGVLIQNEWNLDIIQRFYAGSLTENEIYSYSVDSHFRFRVQI